VSNQITTAFVRQYSSDVQHLLQTRGSQLRPYVMWDTYKGEGGRPVNQIGSVTAVKKTVRHADTPVADTPHAARWIEPADYEVPADLIDKEDRLRILFDPAGPYQQAHAFALGRAIDAEIVGAFFATSKTGPQGGSTEAFDTTNYQIAAGGTNLTVPKLRTALRMLMAAKNRLEVDPPYIAITARQHDSLLQEPEVISRDYNSALVMEDGKVRRFLGFTFIHLEELGIDGASARRCPCWVKSGMHSGMWNDIETRISERADKSYATQVYSRGTFGATRLEQGKVIEILCAE
jgi:hypothetical protein